MTFRLQAKHVLLTFSQCTLTKDQLFDHFSSFRELDHILVAQELHQDGNTHFHCYVSFHSKPNIRNERHFDFNGFHPNIAIRPKKRAIEYATKEDKEPKANFEWQILKPIEKAYQIIQDYHKEGKSEHEIFHAAIATDKSLIRSACSVGYYVGRLKNIKMGSPAKFDLESFALSITDEARLSLWSDTVKVMRRGDRNAIKSIWFTGPTMYGKTSLARSLGNHWYMQNIWNIKKIQDDDGYYGVLDDIEWDDIRKYYKSLLGRQLEVELTDKYKHKDTYKMGYPVIICTNELPDFTPQERNWLQGNVLFYCINSSVLPSSPIIPFQTIHF